MEMLCPECRGPLTTSDGQTARCTLHGGEYQILFSRWAPGPPPLPPSTAATGDQPAAAPPPGTNCAQHPQVAAMHLCRQCRTPMCATCAFLEPGGPLCAKCITQAVTVRPSGPPPIIPPAIPEGACCAQHPAVKATQQCQGCKKFICATCHFELPGGLHLCPQCATTPQTKLSSKRKLLLVGAFVLAVWSTVVLAALMSGVLANYVRSKQDEDVLGIMLTLFLLVPSVAGLALGASTIDRRLHNPPIVWIAAVWNGLIVAGFVLLCIIGMFR